MNCITRQSYTNALLQYRIHTKHNPVPNLIHIVSHVAHVCCLYVWQWCAYVSSCVYSTIYIQISRICIKKISSVYTSARGQFDFVKYVLTMVASYFIFLVLLLCSALIFIVVVLSLTIQKHYTARYTLHTHTRSYVRTCSVCICIVTFFCSLFIPLIYKKKKKMGRKIRATENEMSERDNMRQGCARYEIERDRLSNYYWTLTYYKDFSCDRQLRFYVPDILYIFSRRNFCSISENYMYSLFCFRLFCACLFCLYSYVIQFISEWKTESK